MGSVGFIVPVGRFGEATKVKSLTQVATRMRLVPALLAVAVAINAAGQSLASTSVPVSPDEGRTWQDRPPVVVTGRGPVPPVRPNPTSLDPYIYADPVTGRLFNIDLNLAAGGFLSYSDDG